MLREVKQEEEGERRRGEGHRLLQDKSHGSRRVGYDADHEEAATSSIIDRGQKPIIFSKTFMAF